jgi:hypothetical protein
MTFTRFSLLFLSLSCYGQSKGDVSGPVDWEGRRGDTVETNKCEAGFVLLTNTCVPTKHVIDLLINKLSEAAYAMRETRTSVHNLKEEVARLSVVVDILEQENNLLHARVNALTPVKKK